ncbi:MAG: DUF4811 domain-containing protein [Lactobacillaceae bacterium]|jgi:mRNA-degrading endonuclease HigB of HigAB toxin-antitoxin module|nr:DUF4811 domain-containing protein [Lactobacillaceae bacterium]
MIIGVIAVFAILTFVSWTLISKKAFRFIFGTISLLGLILSVFATSEHMFNYYGVKKDIQTTKTQIFSATGNKTPAGILIAEPINKGSKVDAYVYSKDASATDTKVDAPKLDKTMKVVKVGGEKAYRVLKVTKYKYNNSFFKFLFGVFEMDKVVTKTEVTYQLPETWTTASKEELTAMQKAIATLTPDSDPAVLLLAQDMKKAMAEGDLKKAAANNISLIQATNRPK